MTCPHPPTRLYAWHAQDGVLCVACCACGAVLRGAADSPVIVRVKSHRARQRLTQAVGRLPQGFHSWDFPGEFREITAEEFAKARAIPGITRARVNRESLSPYFDWS